MLDFNGVSTYTPKDYVYHFVNAQRKEDGKFDSRWFRLGAKMLFGMPQDAKVSEYQQQIQDFAKKHNRPVVGIFRFIAETAAVNAGYDDLVRYCKEMGSATMEAVRDMQDNHNEKFTPLDELDMHTDCYIDISPTKCHVKPDNMALTDDQYSSYCGMD